MLSELTVFNREFPGGISNDNVKWRAVVWIASEVFLLLAVISNLMPRTFYSPSDIFLCRVLFCRAPNQLHLCLSANRFSLIFKASALIIAIDFLLTVIWLPIGVSKTYGFQSAAFVFKSTFNGTGAVSRLSFSWFSMQKGIDWKTRGTGEELELDLVIHVYMCRVDWIWCCRPHCWRNQGRESQQCQVHLRLPRACLYIYWYRLLIRGIFWSAAVSALVAFVRSFAFLHLAFADLRTDRCCSWQPLIILFLFCSPSMDVLFTLAAPQPFVLIYQLALGKGGQLVMTLVAVIGLQVVSLRIYRDLHKSYVLFRRTHVW